MESFSNECQELKIAQVKDIKALEGVTEDVEALKSCYKFGPRLKYLENQAKSDLLAVTRKLNELQIANSFNLKRSEALKLVYTMSTDIIKNIMDPVAHKSGKKPS